MVKYSTSPYDPDAKLPVAVALRGDHCLAESRENYTSVCAPCVHRYSIRIINRLCLLLIYDAGALAALGMLVAGVIVCIALLTKPVDGTDGVGQLWESPDHLRCGQNALYLFLNLHGVAAEYERLGQQLSLTHRGATLSQLQKATETFGLHTRACKGNKLDLVRCQKPVIVHTRRSDRRLDRSAEGHYVVVTGTDSQAFSYYDGSTGRLIRANPDRFLMYWSGYMLVADAPLINCRGILFTAGIAILGLATAASILYKHNMIKSLSRGSDLKALVLFIALVPLIQLLSTPNAFGNVPDKVGQSEPTLWRDHDHELENCLYIVMYAMELSPEYHSVQRAVASSNRVNRAARLLEASKICQIPLVARRNGVADIHQIDGPFFAYIENYRSMPSELIVVVATEPSRLTLFRGSTATLETLSIDDFLRTWDGWIYSPGKNEPTWLIPSAITCGLVAFYSLWRVKK